MSFPVMRGMIDRRLLVNYAVDSDVLQQLLPPPFRPKVVHGFRDGRDLPHQTHRDATVPACRHWLACAPRTLHIG